MTRQAEEESDIPDFLHNSPFLPISDGLAYSYPKDIPKPKPTLRQLLMSKPTRIAIATFFALLVFLYFRSRFRSAHVLDRLTGPSCYFTEPQVPDESYLFQDVDWSQLAYALYATNVEYLCNAVMLFEILQRLGSQAERLLLYPETYSLQDSTQNVETRLLLKARDELGVVLKPIKVLHEPTAYYYGPNWADSYTKLLAFNQTQYTRLIVLDSDSTILSPMDSLFFLPPAPAIMPRAYWLAPKAILSSHIMVITPSPSSFSMVEKAIKKARYGTYDMEIMNSLFGSTCLLLPHRNYALLTGEFRSDNHENFLDLDSKVAWAGSEVESTEEWNPDVVINDAKFVHFSDHPLGKPWVATDKEIDRMKPGCFKTTWWQDHECKNRGVWSDLYEDFRQRRKRVCGSV